MWKVIRPHRLLKYRLRKVRKGDEAFDNKIHARADVQEGKRVHKHHPQDHRTPVVAPEAVSMEKLLHLSWWFMNTDVSKTFIEHVIRKANKISSNCKIGNNHTRDMPKKLFGFRRKRRIPSKQVETAVQEPCEQESNPQYLICCFVSLKLVLGEHS